MIVIKVLCVMIIVAIILYTISQESLYKLELWVRYIFSVFMQEDQKAPPWVTIVLLIIWLVLVLTM